jgi:hypothetical protein
MNMGMDRKDREISQASDSGLEQRARALLIGSAENLPAAVRSRLTQARHAALNARQARLRWRLSHWLPAGVVATAVVAVLVVLVPHGRPTPVSAANPLLNAAGVEDIELLSSSVPLNDDQDVDYDFYEWAVDTAGPGPVGAAHAVATGSSGT